MDAITIEILEDGTVKVVTDQISAGNHRNADEALQMLRGLLGAPVAMEPRARKRGHGHTQTDRRIRL